MKSILRFDQKNTTTIPIKLQGLEERFSEDFLEYFFGRYTKPGDIILDPFAGMGTSIVVAQRMGRECYGFEPNIERYSFIKSQIKDPQRFLFNASAFDIRKYNIPNIDFSISSPPYTHILHRNNPLRQPIKNGVNPYGRFLGDIGNIYNQIKNRLTHKGYCIIEVSNIFDENHNFSPLAWDIAMKVSEIMSLQEEIIIERDKVQYGVAHSYCFVFQNI